MLENKKTYITAVFLLALGGLYGLGYISREQLETLTVLAGSVGIVTMRQSISKMDDKLDSKMKK